MTEAVAILAGSSLRVALLAAIVLLVLSASTRLSAATRHGVWLVTLIAAVLMPGLGRLLPKLSVAGMQLPAITQLPATPRATDIGPGAQPSTNVKSISSEGVAGTVNKGAATPTTLRTVSVVQVIAVTWLIGVAVTLAMLAAGWRSARRLVAAAQPSLDARIRSALDEGRRINNIQTPVGLKTSDKTSIPFVFETFHPTLVLPVSAESWDDQILSLVVAHELAHISRHDAATQRFADLACSLYWFHPAVWFAAFRLRRESELACDDAVLAKGSSAPAYADLLVSLAAAGGRAAPHYGLAMARPGTLEARVVALLDTGRTRRNRRASAWMTLSVLAGLSIVLAATHPARAAARIERAEPTQSSESTASPTRAEITRGQTDAEPADVPVPPTAVVSSNLPSQFRVNTRSGVCGRGIPDEITFTTRPVNTAECRAGMAVIEIVSRGGNVVDVHATIGAREGSSPIIEPRIAASELLASIPSLDGDAGSRAIQAAALMENGATAREILSVATDGRLAPVTRRMAVTWLGIVGGNSATVSLNDLALNESVEESVREQALIALGEAGLQTALRIARASSSEDMRRIAFHRASLQLSAAELVTMFPTLTEGKLKQRVVDAVAGSNDANAKRRLAGMIAADADESFRVKALERLARQ